MRNCLLGVVIAVALALSACNGRSSDSNPKAFCSALKKIAVQSAGLQDNGLTPALAKQQAASLQQLVAIAPVELESAVKTEAHAWNQFVKTGDHSELVGQKYAAATDQVNTWAGAYCK